MNTPKTFYRKLDALLARIGRDKSDKNFLTSILAELEQNFGNDLHILDGSIYELRDREYFLTNSSGRNHWVEKLSVDSPVIQLVLEHGSFIYDNRMLSQYFGLKNEQAYITPAAISVNSPERQLVLGFSLIDGWSREEITLFLNAVRTALNYRLFSDIIGGELQQAVQIQKSLLPRKNPNYEGFQIYGHSIPAELVGGDFYEYFEFDEGTFGLTVGDASGHGLPAALLVRDVVIGLRMGLVSEYKSVYTLRRLNKVIQRSTYSSNFVSLFMAEIEKNGHLFYINAGHPAPFVVSGQNISELGPTGIVLGFIKDIELHRSHIYLESGSVMVAFSDGIIERQDTNEIQFGEERLRELVLKHQQKEAKQIVELIFKTVFEFGNSKNWEDDATVVVIKRLK